MSKDAAVEIVSSSLSGGDAEDSSDDRPARLMRSEDLIELDTQEYPEITAHVNVESSEGTIEDLDKRAFEVHENEDNREILDFDFINDALDLVFVFDDTGSMGDEIDGAKAGVTDLTDSIDSTNIDARYGLVTFKDDVEIDQHFTPKATELKAAVDALEATGGGDAPEANFDAVEHALDLDWRTDAQRVIVDITDASSHYQGDGSEFSNYTFEDVVLDIQVADVTFIAVSPDTDNKTSSIKSVAGEVDGLWTDIDELRSGLFSKNTSAENFQKVLERITSLVASTYILTYFSCIPPGDRAEVELIFNHPDYETARDTASVSVPSKFELHPDCEKTGKVVDAGAEANSPKTADTPSVRKVETTDAKPGGPDKSDGSAPRVKKVEDEESEARDLALIIDDDVVASGDTINVTVRDESGGRVEGAKVETSSQTVTTDSRGTCSLRLTDPGDVSIQATKEGDGEEYNVVSTTVSVQEN